MSECDSKKLLDKLLASTSDKKSSLVIFMEAKKMGLADAIDVFDFNIKLESLKFVWDSIMSGAFIHGLYEKEHPYFKIKLSVKLWIIPS